MQHLQLVGVVLRTVDYGEADRVVTLLTQERGKVAAFAKGARKSRRRFGGALEPFTLLSAEVKERGRDLLWLDAVSVRRGFGGIRADLARIACASYACELARELVRDAEPHAELFALVVEYLERLDAAPAHPAALRAFELGALAGAGLMPRLDACVRCGTPARELFAARAGEAAAVGAGEAGAAVGAGAPTGLRGRTRFDAGSGGLLCAACALQAPGAPGLLPETAVALAALQAGGVSGAEEVPLGPAAGAEARDLLGRFVEHHLGRRLQTRRFLDEVGPLLSG
jgi:DNA repair protein RecO (recombination protein O)